MQWSLAIFPDPGRFDSGHLPVRRRRAHLPRERVRQGGDAGGRAPHRDTLHVEARRRLRRQLLQVGEGIGAATWNREGIGGRGYLRTEGVLQLERAPRSSASRQSRRRLLFSISGAQEWTAGGDKLGFGALLNGPGAEGVWPYSDQWWALFDELSRQIVEPYSPKFITTDARMPNKCFPTNNR
jgi:hypothetical protein